MRECGPEWESQPKRAKEGPTGTASLNEVRRDFSSGKRGWRSNPTCVARMDMEDICVREGHVRGTQPSMWCQSLNGIKRASMQQRAINLVATGCWIQTGGLGK